jgi:hypothetical protein
MHTCQQHTCGFSHRVAAFYLPGDLEAQIAALRYHESISKLTPADVYFGRGQTILIERERIKRQTIFGIPRATFYRWYDLYRTGEPDALGDRSPRPDRVWNQIPDMVRQRRASAT